MTTNMKVKRKLIFELIKNQINSNNNTKIK